MGETNPFFEQVKKVAIGAAVAAVGAALTYGTQAISGIDFGAFTPAVVAAFSVFANVIRKAIGL